MPHSPRLRGPRSTEQVTIDGYTQAGASSNAKTLGDDAALKIELTQTSVPGANGLEISNSSNSVIRGLVVNRFGTGVILDTANANRIKGNYIGTDKGGTTVKAQLNNTPAKTFTVQFFSNPSGEEGEKYIGQKLVTTDASGNASFTFKPASQVATGQTITATATDASSEDTSEFSAPGKVVSS